MGCYSTHILISEGTTVVNLTGDTRQETGDGKDYSLILSLQKSITSIGSINIWPTFNCAFATMVHCMERLRMNITFNEKVKPANVQRKSALILVQLI